MLKHRELRNSKQEEGGGKRNNKVTKYHKNKQSVTGCLENNYYNKMSNELRIFLDQSIFYDC